MRIQPRFGRNQQHTAPGAPHNARRRMDVARHGWLLAALAVTVLSLAVVFAPQVLAAPSQPVDPGKWSQHWDEQVAQGRIVNGDLTVEPGQVIESDVVLYDGDVDVREEGRIAGNLVVYSGDIVIDAGGAVDGDVSAFSGDVEIDGTVGGNVASWSGDIALDASAHVGGDISVLSGDVTRDEAAFVGGNIVRGPNLKLGALPFGMFKDGHVPTPPTISVDRGPTSFGARIGEFVLRLFIGFGLALLLVPIAAFVTYAFPDYVAGVEANYRRQPAVSFILGLMTGPVLAVIAVLLAITICGIILIPVPFFLLLGLSFVGWTAIALTVGRRASGLLGMNVATPVLVLIGGAVLALVLVPLWSMGSCFRFFAGAATFLIGAFGLGAAVMPLLNRLGNGRNKARVDAPALPGPGTPVASAPVAPAPTSSSDVAADAPVPPALSVGQTPAAPLREDDFTRINGLGQVDDARLKVAGVRTYAQLAQMTPATIAAAIGWTPVRVEQAGIIAQAAALAQ
ncbi:MAG: polymer-forming cytoskeletal protein [Caldilineaceae bacterium]|nr:polymer-forming cytoskeletal protein [Caldilineaceae bacterium]